MKSIQRGFTLIEILIALSLFALIAGMTAAAMYQAFNARARLSAESDRLSNIQLALSLIQQDVRSITARNTYSNDFHLFPAFIGRSAYIEFTRDGLTNPGGINKRSTLQRVAYLCQDDRLVRRSWQATDMSEREQYHDQTLLSHLKACHFGFLHQSLQIFQEWDGIEQNRKNEMISLPKAIQFNVTLEDGGEGPLLFAIPEAVYQNV